VRLHCSGHGGARYLAAVKPGGQPRSMLRRPRGDLPAVARRRKLLAEAEQQRRATAAAAAAAGGGGGGGAGGAPANGHAAGAADEGAAGEGAAGEGMCVVCFAQPCDTVFPACGHMCACGGCAPALARCPICRARGGCIRVYRT
jgi:hypothetical protein